MPISHNVERPASFSRQRSVSRQRSAMLHEVALRLFLLLLILASRFSSNRVASHGQSMRSHTSGTGTESDVADQAARSDWLLGSVGFERRISGIGYITMGNERGFVIEIRLS